MIDATSGGLMENKIPQQARDWIDTMAATAGSHKACLKPFRTIHKVSSSTLSNQIKKN